MKSYVLPSVAVDRLLGLVLGQYIAQMLSGGPALADAATSRPWWEDLLIGAAGPVAAALLAACLGAYIVGRLLASAEARRDDSIRAESDRQADEQLRQDLGVEIMQVAYGFYLPVQEIYWRRAYEQSVNVDHLSQLRNQFEAFRVNARVLEAKLDDIGERPRWLWHGVVDLLTARYYFIAQPAQRFEDLTTRHGLHADLAGPDASKIPRSVAQLLPTKDDLRSQSETLKRFESLLDLLLRELRGISRPAVLAHPDPQPL